MVAARVPRAQLGLCSGVSQVMSSPYLTRASMVSDTSQIAGIESDLSQRLLDGTLLEALQLKDSSIVAVSNLTTVEVGTDDKGWFLPRLSQLTLAKKSSTCQICCGL